MVVSVKPRTVVAQPRTGGVIDPAKLDELEASLGIKPLADVVEPLKIFVYGASGVGKTVLAASIAEVMEPVLLINIEAGTRSIKQRKGIFNVDIKTPAQVRQLQAYLRTAHSKYKAIVFDGITEFRVMQSRGVLAQSIAEDSTHDKEVLSLRDYMKVFDRTREFARFLRDLPVYVVMTALEETVKDEDSGALHIMPMLSEKLNGSVPGYFDIVGWLTTVKPNRDAERIRRLYVQPTERRRGKDRSDSLGEYLDEPTMAKLIGRAHV